MLWLIFFLDTIGFETRHPPHDDCSYYQAKTPIDSFLLWVGFDPKSLVRSPTINFTNWANWNQKSCSYWIQRLLTIQPIRFLNTAINYNLWRYMLSLVIIKDYVMLEKTFSNNKMVNNFETSRKGNVNIYKFDVQEVSQKSDKCKG